MNKIITGEDVNKYINLNPKKCFICLSNIDSGRKIFIKLIKHDGDRHTLINEYREVCRKNPNFNFDEEYIHEKCYENR